MKIFAIEEKQDKTIVVGYLFYHEKQEEFIIELLDDLNEYDVPFVLAPFYRKGRRSISPNYSRLFVEQRIIPYDRQNIAQIIKENKLKNYDLFSFLMLAKGRCEQDNFYLSEIKDEDLNKNIKQRLTYRISSLTILNDNELLISLNDGSLGKYNLNKYLKTRGEFEVLNKDNELYNSLEIMVGGYGLLWAEYLEIPYFDINLLKDEDNLSSEDLKKFLNDNLIGSDEATKILNCSRQYINELIKTKRLKSIKTIGKTTLFLKEELLKLKWQ